jgi:hypothetical protein
VKFGAGFLYGLAAGLVASLPLAYALWRFLR